MIKIFQFIMPIVTGFCPELAAIHHIIYQYNAIVAVDGAIAATQLNIDFSVHKSYE
jgi:selenocysteine lyase/cysteine desulfurase